MSDAIPIEIPERLPIRIARCPIVEAIFDARFVSPQPWTTMPGLLFAQIRERYPEQKDLPLAQLPEEVRRQDSALVFLPLVQFLGESFSIQLGPRVVALLTKPNVYPGWSAIKEELTWLIKKLKAAGFVGETERLAARYIDFFSGNIFGALRLGLQIDEKPWLATQTDLTTLLKLGELSIRLHVTNGAIVATKDGPKTGSVLDIDASFGALNVDLFENGITRFGEAHHAIKGMFFGLIKPEMLSRLEPTYE